MNYLTQFELYRDLPVYRLTIAWGIEGLHVVSNPSLDDAFTGDSPRWYNVFDPSPPAAQSAALDLCEGMAKLPQVRSDKPRVCFLQHFAAWRRTSRGGTSPKGFPTAASQFVPLLDLFVTIERRTRKAGAAGCAGLAAQLATSGFVTFSADVVQRECLAFWDAAPPFLEAPDFPSDSLPEWSSYVLWSCPQQEMDRACHPPSDDARAHYDQYVARPLGFYATYEISFSRFASAAAARAYFDAFESLVASSNAAAPRGLRAKQALEQWMPMRVEELLVFGACVGAAISLLVCLVTITLLLRNWQLALITSAHVGVIATCSIGTFVWMGWELGFIEALCIIIVIGFSVDFVAHVAIAYEQEEEEEEEARRGESDAEASADGGKMVGERGEGGEGGEGGESGGGAVGASVSSGTGAAGAVKAVAPATSLQKVERAVGKLGISILSGAVSTGAVSIFMTMCMLTPFRRVGTFMLVAIFFSTLAALVVLPITLAHWGPTGSQARLVCLDRFYSRASRALDLTLDGCARVLTKVCRRCKCLLGPRVLLLQVHGFVRGTCLCRRGRRVATTLTRDTSRIAEPTRC